MKVTKWIAPAFVTGVICLTVTTLTVHSSQTEIFDHVPWLLYRNDDTLNVVSNQLMEQGFSTSGGQVIGQSSGDYWVLFQGENNQINGQRFNSFNEKISDMAKFTTIENDFMSSVRFPENDTFVVGYEASPNPSDTEWIYFRIIAADGTPITDEIMASKNTTDYDTLMASMTAVTVTNHSSGTDVIIVTMMDMYLGSRLRLFDGRDGSRLTDDIIVDPQAPWYYWPVSCFAVDSNRFVTVTMIFSTGTSQFADVKATVFDGEGNITLGPLVIEQIPGDNLQTVNAMSLGKNGFWAVMHMTEEVVFMSVYDQYLNECGFSIRNDSDAAVEYLSSLMFLAAFSPDESSVVFGYSYMSSQGASQVRVRAQLYGFDFPTTDDDDSGGDGSDDSNVGKICSENDQAYVIGDWFDINPTNNDGSDDNSVQYFGYGSAIIDGKFVLTNVDKSVPTPEVKASVFQLDWYSLSPSRTPTMQPTTETMMPSKLTDVPTVNPTETVDDNDSSAFSLYHSGQPMMTTTIVTMLVCIFYCVV